MAHFGRREAETGKKEGRDEEMREGTEGKHREEDGRRKFESARRQI